MTAALAPRPAVEIKPPAFYSAPSRRYLTRDERRQRILAGMTALPELAPVTVYHRPPPSPPMPDRTPRPPISLDRELHYSPSSAFSYPMKGSDFDLTVRRDGTRHYIKCQGVLCPHRGHTDEAADVAPPLDMALVPTFQSGGPVLGPVDRTRHDSYCRAHRRFDCPHHARRDCDRRTVVTVGELPALPPGAARPTPVNRSRFEVDGAGITTDRRRSLDEEIEALLAADPSFAEAVDAAARDIAARV